MRILDANGNTRPYADFSGSISEVVADANNPMDKNVLIELGNGDVSVARDRHRGGQVNQPPNDSRSNADDRVFDDPLRLLHGIHFHAPPAALCRRA